MASIPTAQAVAIAFSAAGANAASIQPTVDSFRAALGTLNANTPGSVGDGRREINWDGVPQGFSSPNPFPADFFNANTPGRARGVVFATPGTGFGVSANAADGPVQFGDINPSYPSVFEPFSAEKLFSPIASTVTDVRFLVPGSNVPATTDGFGVVFSDVDSNSSTSLQFFDFNGVPLGTYFAPGVPGANETFSFLGVVFDQAVVGLVRIVSGNVALSAGPLTEDLVVMDDFIYGEPRNVPDAGGTFGLLAFSVLGVVCLARVRFARARAAN